MGRISTQNGFLFAVSTLVCLFYSASINAKTTHKSIDNLNHTVVQSHKIKDTTRRVDLVRDKCASKKQCSVSLELRSFNGDLLGKIALLTKVDSGKITTYKTTKNKKPKSANHFFNQQNLESFDFGDNENNPDNATITSRLLALNDGNHLLILKFNTGYEYLNNWYQFYLVGERNIRFLYNSQGKYRRQFQVLQQINKANALPLRLHKQNLRHFYTDAYHDTVDEIEIRWDRTRKKLTTRSVLKNMVKLVVGHFDTIEKAIKAREPYNACLGMPYAIPASAKDYQKTLLVYYFNNRAEAEKAKAQTQRCHKNSYPMSIINPGNQID
jgi:hypothetical protein